MESYLVRQPIFDVDTQEVHGYELIYRPSLTWKEDEKTDSQSVANVISGLFSETNSKWICDDKPAFITFTDQLIKANIADLFSHDKLVIQIEDSIIVNPVLLQKIYDLKEKGYVFALNEFSFNQRYMNLLRLVSYIKVDFQKMDEELVKNIIQVSSGMGKQLIATHVDTQEQYEMMKNYGFHFVEGSYFSKPIVTPTSNKMDYIHTNFFQLATELTRDEPDIDVIEEIISRDVTMTYKLIKLINSAYYSLRTTVRSVKQAVIIMGLKQLRDWIYLLSFESVKSQKPDELIRLSFLRGELCKNLAAAVPTLEDLQSDSYLMGMFSTLDSLLDCELGIVLQDLPIMDGVKEALLEGKGQLGDLYYLVLAYEKGDWVSVSSHADNLGIAYNMITQKYFECVANVNETWSHLMQSTDLD